MHDRYIYTARPGDALLAGFAQCFTSASVNPSEEKAIAEGELYRELYHTVLCNYSALLNDRHEIFSFRRKAERDAFEEGVNAVAGPNVEVSSYNGVIAPVALQAALDERGPGGLRREAPELDPIHTTIAQFVATFFGEERHRAAECRNHFEEWPELIEVVAQAGAIVEEYVQIVKAEGNDLSGWYEILDSVAQALAIQIIADAGTPNWVNLSRDIEDAVRANIEK